MIKNYFRILKKPHAYLHTILKTPVKFQKDWTETVGGVKGTKYPLKTRNHAPRTTHHAPRATHHAPRKTKNSVPPLFFEKAGDNNWRNVSICHLKPDLNNVWLKSIDIYSSYRPETKPRTDGRQTNGRTYGRPTWKHNTHLLSCGRVWKADVA